MTTIEALVIRNPYPEKTLAKATAEAMELSAKHPHVFVYVRLSTSTGMYSVDLIGNYYSDIRIVATYFNKERTL